jgi:hypothetical protein
LLDHTGYLAFAEPFQRAFREGGEPQFERDRLFLAYQLHPRNARPVEGSPAHMLGGRVWRRQLPDRIFAAAHLTAPARLRLNGELSAEFPAGTAHFDIPLAVGEAPRVAIVRDGAEVLVGQGPLPITDDPKPGAWNYLAVEVGAAASLHPAGRSADQ